MFGKSQKLVGQPIVKFTKTGRAAALPAPLVPPALFTLVRPTDVWRENSNALKCLDTLVFLVCEQVVISEQGY